MPFQCPHCEQNFSRRSSLRNHIKIHDTSVGRHLIERRLQEIEEQQQQLENQFNLINVRRETNVEMDAEDEGITNVGRETNVETGVDVRHVEMDVEDEEIMNVERETNVEIGVDVKHVEMDVEDEEEVEDEKEMEYHQVIYYIYIIIIKNNNTFFVIRVFTCLFTGRNRIYIA
jgi:hypothetical protein